MKNPKPTLKPQQETLWCEENHSLNTGNYKATKTSAVLFQNEKIKKKYLNSLKEARGYSPATLEKKEQAILLWQEFTKNEDFKRFTTDKAKNFKRFLTTKVFRGNPISVVTCYAYLRYVRNFFEWLSREPGYISRIKINDLEYLKSSNADKEIATQPSHRRYPIIEDIKKVIQSIEPKTEIDRRDRALIAFTFTSGARIHAVISLPFGCFNPETLEVDQDSKKEVKTKNNKKISSILLRFDEEMIDLIINWVKELEVKGFGPKDPLFPSSLADKGKDNLSFQFATQVGRNFWKGPGTAEAMFKKRTVAAGVTTFSPHDLRRRHVAQARKFATGPEDMKAISVNLGHKFLATTMGDYGQMEPEQVKEIINRLVFKEKPTVEQKIDKLLNLVNKKAAP